MSEEKLNAILEKAAKDKKFCKLLFQDRAKALADFELNEAEKNMLLSATDAQLNKMIKQKRSWFDREVNPLNNPIGCASAVTLGLGAGFLMLASMQTAGSSPRVSEEVIAQSILQSVYTAEESYRHKFGCYTDYETLQQTKYLNKGKYSPYHIKITLKEDGLYKATLTHKKRPETRAKFELEPGKDIQRIAPAEK